MKEIINYVLLSYIAVFLASIAFLSIKVKKETGVFPIVRNTDAVYGFVDRIILFSYALIIANALFYVSGLLEVYEFFDLLHLKILGLLIIGPAMITMFMAQLQMKDNWRIGIDDKNKIDLVEKGLFNHFRHPIYFCAVVIGIGTLFIIPAMSTLLTAFILWAAVSIQARLEESFLLSNFGDKYKSLT